MAEVPLLRIDERLIHGQVVAGFCAVCLATV